MFKRNKLTCCFIVIKKKFKEGFIVDSFNHVIFDKKSLLFRINECKCCCFQ